MEKVRYNAEVLSMGDRVEYSDNLALDVMRYVGPTIVLPDKTVIDEGRYIGELHLNPIISDSKSNFAAAKEFTIEAVRGLWNLAYDCENDEYLEDVIAFHGISDIIRPTFAQKLDFPDNCLTLYGDQEGMKKRLSALRTSDGQQNTRVKDVYELWLSRHQLMSKKQNFGAFYNKL
jgi:hypothetical protein